MVQKLFDINNLQGLTDEEVIERLAQDGYNELPSTEKRTIFHILFEVIREPMFLLLIACGALYLVLGDVQEAMMLLGFVFVVIGITIYQEQKTEKALDALRDLIQPARAGHPQWGAEAHRRPRSGPRRYRADFRRRPRPGRFGSALSHQPAGGRIPADRRIGAGAQEGLGWSG